ncbi:MAG: DUF1829 domain-containing protein [bacterium]
MIKDVKNLLDDYYKWLKDKTVLKELGEYCEITTPYLDRHNDYIQIYLKRKDNNFILTDDSYTITDLVQTGCSLDSPRRKLLLQATLNGFGVKLEKDALIVKSTVDNFPLKKHNLVQAILAVNDMFYLATANIKSLFYEDVRNWLDISDIRYSERITFLGHSGYPRTFDFLISKSKEAPERIIKTINNPSRGSADNLAFDWLDTKDNRPENSKAYAIINDLDRKVSSSIIDALENYNIKPVLFTKIDKMKQELAA